MKFKPSNNSIFALLLRSPWWWSAAVALLPVIFAATLFPTYLAIGIFSGLPFAGIAVASAWKRRKLPSASRVERTVEALRAMSWGEFSSTLEAALRYDGCEVERLSENGADFKLVRGSRVCVISAKRWKSARIGVEPLRELLAVHDRQDANECMFVTTGQITDNAVRFAALNQIKLVAGAELALIFPRMHLTTGGSPKTD